MCGISGSRVDSFSVFPFHLQARIEFLINEKWGKEFDLYEK
jgi:hypothetical protein